MGFAPGSVSRRHPARSRNGSALVQRFVAADGSVTSASELYGQRTKPSVQCMIGKLKKERFAPRNKAASAMFSLLWTPP